MMAGADLGDIDSMVVWEPVVDGSAYIGELVALHEKELKNFIGKPRPSLTGGRPTELLGFPLSDAIFADIQKVDLFSVRDKPANRLLLIESDEMAGDGRLSEYLNSLGADAEYQHVPDPKVWLHRRNPVPNKILKSVVSWISEGSNAANGVLNVPTMSCKTTQVPSRFARTSFFNARQFGPKV